MKRILGGFLVGMVLMAAAAVGWAAHGQPSLASFARTKQMHQEGLRAYQAYVSDLYAAMERGSPKAPTCEQILAALPDGSYVRRQDGPNGFVYIQIGQPEAPEAERQ